jgi:hypothetical protein
MRTSEQNDSTKTSWTIVTAKFVLATKKYSTYNGLRIEMIKMPRTNVFFSAIKNSGRVSSASPHKFTLELSKSLRNIANYIRTMKYALFLLAAMLSLGAVCGAEIGARIQGVVTAEEPCSDGVEEVLWEECVEDVAISLGVDISYRRLELRGNRELQQANFCSSCCPECTDCGCYPRGTYCFTKCSSRRRLTVADEKAHIARFLTSTGEIQKAANECLDRKIEEGYTCLGKPEDLTVNIFLSE